MDSINSDENPPAAFSTRKPSVSSWILFLVALCSLVWAIEGAGFPAVSVRWTTAVCGLGLALVALTLRTHWRRFAAWAALAFVGQAGTLQLLEVGPTSRLQLFYSWDALLRPYRGLFLLMLAAQGAIVAWGLRELWVARRRAWPAILSRPQAAVLLLLVAFATVTFAPSFAQSFVYGGFPGKLVIYLTKLGLGLVISAVGLTNLSLAAAAIPSDALERIAAGWQRAERRWLPWTCALWVVVVSSVLAWTVFDRLPHIPDEVAYYLHAKYFASGRLYLPLPPEPDAFACSLVMADGQKWYSAQLPGWPAVLAIGMRLGVPWLVNPVLGGLAILLAHAFVRRLYDRAVADGVVLLLAFSPWLLFLSASFMGHPASLVFTLACLWGAHQAREKGSLLGGMVAGAFLGTLADTRPLEALSLAGLVGVWWLSAGWKRLRISSVGVAVLAGAIIFGLQLAYNRVLTGDPFTIPFTKFFDQVAYPGANRIGFGRDVGNLGWTHLDPLPGHGPIDVLANTNQNLYMLNFELYGWACGSMLFVFLLLAWARVRRDLLMWGVVFAIWLGMSFYWFSGGPDFGARYWYQMIVPLAVLTFRGAQEFAARWRGASDSKSDRATGDRVWAFLALASLLGFLNLLPWRSLDKYKNYRGVRGDVRELARQYNFGRSLVFVRGEPRRPPWGSSEYASAFALNPPTLDRNAPGPIYVRDLSPESRERLRNYYADRPVWTIAVPALTRDGFRVIEGPLPAQSPQQTAAPRAATP